jgi:hypothetical protein
MGRPRWNQPLADQSFVRHEAARVLSNVHEDDTTLPDRIPRKRMSKPLWIPCRGVGDIPPISQIRQCVSNDRHVVLKFLPTPAGKLAAADKQLVIQKLASQLPDCTVFDSGGGSGESTWITIKEVISEQDVLASAEGIVAAMRLFRATACELMGRLAQQLGVPLEAFSNRYFRLQYAHSVKLAGRVGECIDRSGEELARGPFQRLIGRFWPVFEQKTAEWEYYFHGGECQFRNVRTGQIVEVCLGFRDEFGVLDPYFFFQFVSTTPALEKVAQLFTDGFHDTLRALEILERHGYLGRISSQSGDRAGLIAPDSECAGRETGQR